jgi:glycosyltransferase involved in cell wall biosynthesis
MGLVSVAQRRLQNRQTMIDPILYTLFLGSASAVLYIWLGYPGFLFLLGHLRKYPIDKRKITPTVSIVIAVRNEEKGIGDRIRNLLELDYPPDLFEVYVASDGSIDRTVEIARAFSDERVHVLEFPKQRGRALVHNDVVPLTKGDIIVFTDSATRFDPSFLSEIVSNYADPRVGCVNGMLDFENRNASTITRQRGLYWRYELWLRQAETDCGIFLCASGPCMSVRRNLFRPLQNPTYDVDFMTPLDVIEAGALVVQDSKARATDLMFSSSQQELKAQARMVSRNLGGYSDRRFLVGPARLVPYAWSLLSHKVLRWLTPFFLLTALLGNILLSVRGHAMFLLLLQLAFYAAAAIGWWLMELKRPASIFSGPFAFCLANVGFFLGVMKCVGNERVTTY